MSASPPPQGQNHTAAQAAFLPLTGRLLVVRLSAMGDIIHALPAMTALRAANPDLHIGWLVEERWAELLCARGSERMSERSAAKPLVDSVHVANFKAWRQALLSKQSWREMKALRVEVRGHEVRSRARPARRDPFCASRRRPVARAGVWARRSRAKSLRRCFTTGRLIPRALTWSSRL